MVIEIKEASTINYSQPLHPDMLTKKGYVVDGSQSGLKIRFRSAYVESFVRAKVIEALGVASIEEVPGFQG